MVRMQNENMDENLLHALYQVESRPPDDAAQKLPTFVIAGFLP